jgi:signal transduction histidine kinase
MITDEATWLCADIALNPHVAGNERALLRALLQATDYGVLVTDLNRQDIVANRRLGELFAVSPHSIVETPPDAVRDMVRARVRDPAGFDARLRQIYADPALLCEDELELSGEPPRILRRFTAPLRDVQGRPVARVWTFLDVTETRRLQEQVQAQLAARTEEFTATSGVLRVMNELCRVAMQHATTEALLGAVADLVRPLFGFRGAAVLRLSEDGTELRGVCSPLKGPKAPVRLPVCADSALSGALDGTRRGKNGPLTVCRKPPAAVAEWFEDGRVGIAPLYSEVRVIGVLIVGLGRDRERLDSHQTALLRAVVDQIALTLETHRLQMEVRAALERLQATQRQMIELEKLRTAGTLAASVAHDIRNILTGIQIERALQEGPGAEALSVHFNRLSALTHRLLAFSQPTVLDTQPVSIEEVLRRVAPLVAGQAEINDVEMRLRFPPDLPPVAADAGQLEQLFVNLCLNAVQAMGERGGTLTLAGRGADRWVEVTVTDTGCGIPPEYLDRLFDPFFTTRANGFGLGLFSCRRIAEDHGGRLTVQSAPGEGTCFTVSLPVG